MNDWQIEQLKTISNLCQIAIIVKEQGRDDLMPSIIEVIYLESQGMVDDHCIKDE